MPAIAADPMTLPRLSVDPASTLRTVKTVTNAPQGYEGSGRTRHSELSKETSYRASQTKAYSRAVWSEGRAVPDEQLVSLRP